jgi:hypothetical protein
VSLTARMDETRIDNRIDAGARVGAVPSSPTRSPLHLASLSSEPLGSPYTDGSPNTASAGLGMNWNQLLCAPLVAHIHSCFALSICAHPRFAHIYSGFAREYALGSTSRRPCFSFV